MVIAVILEAFGDCDTNEAMEVLDECKAHWRHYDPQLQMFLPIERVLWFVQDIAAKFDVDLMPKPEDKTSDRYPSLFSLIAPTEGDEQSKRPFDLKKIALPMTPKIKGVMVKFDGSVHFAYATKIAMAVVVTKNDVEMMDEFEEKDGCDEELRKIQEKQAKEIFGYDQIVDKETEKTIEFIKALPLPAYIAGLKIQGQMKIRLARKRKQAGLPPRPGQLDCEDLGADDAAKEAEPVCDDTLAPAEVVHPARGEDQHDTLPGDIPGVNRGSRVSEERP